MIALLTAWLDVQASIFQWQAHLARAAVLGSCQTETAAPLRLVVVNGPSAWLSSLDVCSLGSSGSTLHDNRRGVLS